MSEVGEAGSGLNFSWSFSELSQSLPWPHCHLQETDGNFFYGVGFC